MTIFKYTMIKYLKATSTWVIMVISIFLSFFLGGWLPFHFLDTNKSDSAQTYVVTIILLVSSLTMFLSLFTSVFAGFKAAKMYKDEVEDGTFLILLSKPISRSKLILFKWFALQTMMALYTFITSITFLFAVLFFDKGHMIEGLAALKINTLKSQMLSVFFIMWSVLLLSGLIFSSIALTLSTKISTGATIGISIAIGVIIPITGMVSLFTKKPKYESINNRELFLTKQTIDIMKNNITKTSINTSPLKNKLLNMINSIQGTFNSYYDFAISDPNSIYNLGVKTDDSDAYRMAWIFDINFQMQRLSSFASDQVVDPSISNAALEDSRRGRSSLPSTNIKSHNIDANVNKLFENNNEKIKPLRKELYNLFFSFVPPIFLSLVQNNNDFKMSLSKGSFNKMIQDFQLNLPQNNDPNIQDIDDLKLDLNTINLIINGLDTYFKKNDADGAQGYILEIEKIKNDNATKIKMDDFADFISKLHLSFLSIPTKTNDEILISTILKFFDQMQHPVSSLLISRNTLERGISNLKVKPEDASKADVAKVSIMKNTNEIKTYSIIKSLVNNNPENIVKIKSVDYVNKYGILIAYLLIALSLVPISYLLVRKQDFR